MTIEIRYQRKSQPGVDDSGRLTGRAIPYNSWTTIGDPKNYGFREKVNPSAAKKSVNDGDIVLLDNHETRLPLARMSAGTLELRNGGSALDWDAVPADTTYAQDVVKNVRAKNYGGCSFGFEVLRDKWTDEKGNAASPMTGTHREILEMKLHEISICTFPAYGDTSVSSRDQIRSARGADIAELRKARRDAVGIDITVNSPQQGLSYDDQTHGPTISGGFMPNPGDNDDDLDDLGANPRDVDGDGDDDFAPDGSYGDGQTMGTGKAMQPRSARASDPKKPYGDVTYADPGYQKDGKKRYPVDTKAHAMAAWSYINKSSNQSPYSAQQLASIKAKIKSALSKFGVKTDDESKSAAWEALCDYREMTEGFLRDDDFDGDSFGVRPDAYVGTEDANQLARDIHNAFTAEMRVDAIERAIDLNLPDLIPEHWGPDGEIGAGTSADVVRDMDEIYTLALSMNPTNAALTILDRAQPYLSNETRKSAAEKSKDIGKEKLPPGFETFTETITLEEARKKLADANQARYEMDRMNR